MPEGQATRSPRLILIVTTSASLLSGHSGTPGGNQTLTDCLMINENGRLRPVVPAIRFLDHYY
jgi:hypothetical protein